MNGMQMLMKQLGLDPAEIQKAITGLGSAAEEMLNRQQKIIDSMVALDVKVELLLNKVEALRLLADKSAVSECLSIYEEINHGRNSNSSS